jgi:serine/threonine protein kinase
MIAKGTMKFSMKNGKEISEDVQKFLIKTLKSNPDERMTWKELKYHNLMRCNSGRRYLKASFSMEVIDV